MNEVQDVAVSGSTAEETGVLRPPSSVPKKAEETASFVAEVLEREEKRAEEEAVEDRLKQEKRRLVVEQELREREERAARRAVEAEKRRARQATFD